MFNFGSKNVRDVNARGELLFHSHSGHIQEWSSVALAQVLLGSAAASELDSQVKAGFFLHVMEALSSQALQPVTAGVEMCI